MSAVPAKIPPFVFYCIVSAQKEQECADSVSYSESEIRDLGEDLLVLLYSRRLSVMTIGHVGTTGLLPLPPLDS